MTNNYINDKKGQARQQFEKVMEEYKSLLMDKTTPKNQTVAYQKNQMAVFNRLMVAADELDTHNPGEGIFGLIILAMRATLKLKDQNVELEVKVRSLEREISKINKRK
jgi:hypothetical protein